MISGDGYGWRSMKLLVVFLLASSLAAQVPVGHGVRFSKTSPSPTGNGVVLVDLATGALTPVSGLSADAQEAYSGGFDPVTGRLIVGGGGTPGAAGTLRVVQLAGTAAAAEIVIADLGDADVLDLAIDRDGGVMAIESGRLVHVERHVGTITPWDVDAYPGKMSAVATDRATNRCWVATSTSTAFEDNVLIEYDLDAGPGPGTVIASLSFTGLPTEIDGLDYDGLDRLYLGGFDFLFDPLYAYSLSGGTFTPITAGSLTLSGLHVDRRTGDVHVATRVPTLFSAEWLLVDPAIGVPATLATFPPANEIARALKVNDLIDRTEVFPRRFSAAAATLVEMAAHGNAGDFALLYASKVNGVPINPIVLGSGLTDAGGFYTLGINLAPGALAAGITVTLASVRLDLGTGALTFGSEADVLTL